MRNIIFILIAFIYLPNVYASDKTHSVSDISNNLNEPWGMTFINNKTLLITEKTGAIINVDSTTGDKYEIEHDLDF
ncbi:MAG: PQQ-dependent sugar dehydrogenase, partial [Gammaproteobacteria bacterium]